MGLKTTALAAFALLLASGPVQAAEPVSIVAGAEDGKFFELGQILCAVLNRKAQGLDCEVAALPAGDAADSFSNLVNVHNGAGDIGIARSDWQYFAVSGSGPVQFMAQDFGSLRSLFSIDTRPFALVAKRDAGIAGLADLKGKRINIGQPHSDNRTTLETVIAAQAWTEADLRQAEELAAAEQTTAFCLGWVQAVIYNVSHPDPAIDHVTRLCDADLVTVAGPAVDKLVQETPYLVGMTIPGGLYKGESEPVPTFGKTITLISSSDVPEELIYDVVAAVFDNLETLKTLYPSLRHLAPARMLKDGLSAPLHEGAKRYFSEQGLM